MIAGERERGRENERERLSTLPSRRPHGIQTREHSTSPSLIRFAAPNSGDQILPSPLIASTEREMETEQNNGKSQRSLDTAAAAAAAAARQYPDFPTKN